jgi:hypothetical protein
MKVPIGWFIARTSIGLATISNIIKIIVILIIPELLHQKCGASTCFGSNCPSRVKECLSPKQLTYTTNSVRGLISVDFKIQFSIPVSILPDLCNYGTMDITPAFVNVATLQFTTNCTLYMSSRHSCANLFVHMKTALPPCEYPNHEKNGTPPGGRNSPQVPTPPHVGTWKSRINHGFCLLHRNLDTAVPQTGVQNSTTPAKNLQCTNLQLCTTTSTFSPMFNTIYQGYPLVI